MYFWADVFCRWGATLWKCWINVEKYISPQKHPFKANIITLHWQVSKSYLKILNFGKYFCTYFLMSTLSSLSANSPSFLIKLSQQIFIKGTICFIFKALKAGDKVLQIRFHLSLVAIVNMLFRGSGSLKNTFKW